MTWATALGVVLPRAHGRATLPGETHQTERPLPLSSPEFDTAAEGLSTEGSSSPVLQTQSVRPFPEGGESLPAPEQKIVPGTTVSSKQCSWAKQKRQSSRKATGTRNNIFVQNVPPQLSILKLVGDSSRLHDLCVQPSHSRCFGRRSNWDRGRRIVDSYCVCCSA